MKITVDSEEKRFNLRLPSFLIFNPIVATFCGGKKVDSIIKSKVGDIGVHFSSKDARKLFREINRARRKFKDWYIVEVDDSKGETVRVKL
jgi:hypothetical protein